MPKRTTPDAPVVEIIEYTDAPVAHPEVIVPNDVRINGVSVLCSDEPVIVHEMEVPARDVVRVTITLLAKRVIIGHEAL